MRASTLRKTLTGSALTVGLLGLGATAASAAETYEVQRGDTLAQIARAHGIDSWRTIHEANADKLDDPNLIFPGQTLRLSAEAPASSTPAAASGSTYTVVPGDTLAAIARANGLDWRTLYELNTDQLGSPSLIFPGQDLRLTGSAPAPAASESTASESTASESTTSESTASESTASESTASESTASESTASESTASEPSTTTTSSSSDIEPQGTVSMATWDRLAQCESNGNWSINTGNGYYGGLQFALSSWEWVGGTGYPHEASKSEQIARAELLLERQGWNAWPACSRQLGLR
jgi:LysM repeat protein